MNKNIIFHEIHGIIGTISVSSPVFFSPIIVGLLTHNQVKLIFCIQVISYF